MHRCLQLARRGAGYVAPNPMVGAVVVCDGRIIGEGYHRHFGGPHAEPNAIRAVADPELLHRSTLYVSLEPCSHYGKTPPCADLIVSCGIPRVVVGMLDPNPQVAGRGIRKLQAAGIEVVTGVLEAECRELNKHFLTFHEQHRPYVSLKWAQTADGFIDRLRTDGHPTVLSSPLTAMLVHKMRAEHAAILVGTDTARLDNPSLNVRHWYGPAPVRVTIDRHHRLPQDLHLFDGSSPTLVYTRESLEEILADLYDRQLQSLLVEGGSRLHQSFIDAGLWDEIMVEEAPVRLGEGVSAPVVSPRIPYRRERHFGRFYRHYLAAETCPDTPAESLF